MKLKNFFAPIGHFYSPFPDLIEATNSLDKAENQFDLKIPSIELNTQGQLNFLDQIGPAMKECDFPETKTKDFRYYFINDQFSFGDAIVYSSILKTFKPNKLIEIGSGYSSALALDIQDSYHYPKHLTFIEPYPDRLLSLLKENDSTKAEIIKEKIQNVPSHIFSELKEGDVLFVDSSHVAKTGSDLLHILFSILPMLNHGVLIHFHDIFWPFEYPRRWVIDDARAWNELYFLRSFLMYNRHYEIVFFNNYIGHCHSEKALSISEDFMRNPGGSIWLRRNQYD